MKLITISLTAGTHAEATRQSEAVFSILAHVAPVEHIFYGNNGV